MSTFVLSDRADEWRKAYRTGKAVYCVDCKDNGRPEAARLRTVNRSRGTCDPCEALKDKPHIGDPEETWGITSNPFDDSRRDHEARSEGKGKRSGYVYATGLEAQRIRLRMSVTDFARYVSIPRQNLVRWSAGQSEAPIETIEAIAEFLKVDVKELAE